jgi:hypothetical protein
LSAAHAQLWECSAVRRLTTGKLFHAVHERRTVRKRQTKLFEIEPDALFEKFWRSFPRHVSKQDALKAWAQLQPTAELVDHMINALNWQTRQRTWIENGGEFIPYPATWLRGRMWEDEPFHAPPVTKAGSWCQHVPKCISPDWHRVVVAREQGQIPKL